MEKNLPDIGALKKHEGYYFHLISVPFKIKNYTEETVSKINFLYTSGLEYYIINYTQKNSPIKKMFPDLEMSVVRLDDKEENTTNYYFHSNIPFNKIYFQEDVSAIKTTILMGMSGIVGGLLEKFHKMALDKSA